MIPGDHLGSHARYRQWVYVSLLNLVMRTGYCGFELLKLRCERHPRANGVVNVLVWEPAHFAKLSDTEELRITMAFSLVPADLRKHTPRASAGLEPAFRGRGQFAHRPRQLPGAGEH